MPTKRDGPWCDCGRVAVTNDGLLCEKCLRIALRNKDFDDKEPRTLSRRGTESIGRKHTGTDALAGTSEMNNDGDE